MHSYIAKQPIYASDGTLIGNELLYRNNSSSNFYPSNVPHEVATCSVITHKLQELQQTELDCDFPTTAFINFDYQSLVNLTPLLFPKESIVIEVLENIQVDTKLCHALRIIKEKGYSIALDDVQLNSCTIRLLDYISIIKVDITQISIPDAKEMICHLSSRSNIKFIAERIETIVQYEEAVKAGFDYFQGYFFGRPEIHTIDVVQPSSLIELTGPMSDYDTRQFITVMASEDPGSCSTLMNIPSASNDCLSIADVVSGLTRAQLKAFMFVSANTSCNTKRVCRKTYKEKQKGGTEDLLGVLIAISAVLGDVDYDHINSIVSELVTLNCGKVENVTH
ncbi:EAL and HDOD domain-containing protein [Photobacterium lutimaris]|uniref:EAL and HDOD domain-containing protein n=1 Tax=Photobacterium lutimaris TaxID=388278 RepID=UPI0010D630CB|nr:EAL domain-containing protein [Photobacterium lutimaris]TDR72575.1 EAL domain-containing protein [Photobacterium lutimaris]